MNKYMLGGAVAALALAFAPAANAATIFPVGSPNFFITNGTPFTPSITAVFFNSFSTTTAFDDLYTFTIPQNGLGSGSISTSFSGPGNHLTISSLLINGTPYVVPAVANGQSFSVGGIPITAFVLNTIEVIGFTSGSGTYSGTATFTAAPIPEPASWALMLLGFGMIGMAARRARSSSLRVSFS